MRYLMTIPYGKTISYKSLASYTGHKTAIRAVAKANGRNNISIILPCHRVIGENGNLVGYGGGIERKKYLLSLESNSLNIESNDFNNLVYGI
ncbi:MAG: O-6-methylguanine-DNA-alkyltransferase [Rickettsiaceae bacterium]|jgi:O-6-methylguanine DNA methyltransferase|nr:O-6-methylguanine-DNA-alkyltransferase [Rickettsiaceae bacterium]